MERELENTMIGTMSANVSQSTPVIWNDQIFFIGHFKYITKSKDGKQSWKMKQAVPVIQRQS